MSNKNKQINLDENALYLEYTKGVNPIRAGTIKSIPFKSFPSSIHESGKSGLHPLDISNELGVTGPAPHLVFVLILFAYLKMIILRQILIPHQSCSM